MDSKAKYQKKYRQRDSVKKKHRDRMREAYANGRGEGYEKERSRKSAARYARGRYNAKRRGKTFTLTLDQYETLVSQPCAYCNLSISNETGVGLDRIDNDRGYEFGNVNPCCSKCNRIRAKSMNADEFKRQTKLNNRWNESGEK